MSKPLPPSADAHPVTPWYRQAWPWGLILGPAVVVVACFYTIWLAVKTTDPMVVDDYYKQGLAMNRSLERDQLASRLGLQAQLVFAADGVVRITLRAPAELPWPDAITLVLSHPAHEERDQRIPLHISGSAVRSAEYVADAAIRVEPVSYQLALQDNAGSWRLTGRLNPVRQPAIELNPLPLEAGSVLH